MKKNMGTVDKVLRSLVAVLFIGLYAAGIIQGALGIVLIILSIVFLLTSFISFCPIYTLFGWSTKKN